MPDEQRIGGREQLQKIWTKEELDRETAKIWVILWANLSLLFSVRVAFKKEINLSNIPTVAGFFLFWPHQQFLPLNYC